MSVDLCGFNTAVPKQLLDVTQISTPGKIYWH